jgi:hypothetical protein
MLILSSVAQTSQPHTPYVLYAPGNLQAEPVECAVYLHWEKPVEPGGTTPAGLAGYYVFLDGTLMEYMPGPNNLAFYDYFSDPWTPLSYTVTANYDLTPYGFPGQFGQSVSAGPALITLNCDFLWPFIEYWNWGGFAPHWTFQPLQLNWQYNTQAGNPPPQAEFSGSPARTAYEATLISHALPGHWPAACADLFLEFDLELIDLAAGGTEKIQILTWYDKVWHTVAEISNTGTTGWVHYKFDISDAQGKVLKVGFRATGLNSANIVKWCLDNIEVYPVVYGPVNLAATSGFNLVHLTWDPPLCSTPGFTYRYEVYRTNATGNPPFIRLNPSLLTSTEYDDVVPVYSQGMYRYFVIAVYLPLWYTGYSDTLLVTLPLGIGDPARESLLLAPNPCDDECTLTASSPVDWIEIIGMDGRAFNSQRVAGKKEVQIRTEHLPSGLYLLQISTGKNNFLKRMVITR